MIYLIFLIIHLVICLFLYIAIHAGALEITPHMMPIAFFVPLFGMTALIIAERLTRDGMAGTHEVGIEELLLSEDDYRSIRHEDEKTIKSVVPLEEAIRINDTKVRRKLMMDIMKQDPDKYIKLLQQARLNDDMEVTHYASTAMMEVQRKYEIDLQRHEKSLQIKPDDITLLNAYLKVLRRYIDSGMLEENMLLIQRIRYDTLLKKKIAENPSDKEAYFDSAENLIELDSFNEADRMVRLLTNKWPNDENTWIMKLKLYFESGNKIRFDETLLEIKKRNIYFSSQFKSLMSFWETRKNVG